MHIELVLHTWPQTVAAMLLLFEFVHGAIVGTRQRVTATGVTRMLDALIWGFVMYWGGFFSH